MFHFSPIAWYFVIGWIGAGFLLYYTYARQREHEKKATPVVLAQQSVEEKKSYRVLIPVANPETAKSLIDFGAMRARDRDGELMLLHVITVPKQAPYEVGQRYVREARDRVLDRAVEMAEAHEVPVNAVIRIARKPAQAIIDQVEEHAVNMVVMGWRGRSKHPETVIGSNIDRVTREADCDVAVFRGQDVRPVEKICIPMSYPEQAHLMLEIGELFSADQGSELELLHVVPEDLSDAAARDRLDVLYEGLADLGVRPGEESGARRAIRMVRNDDVVEAISESAAGSDLLIIGADREGWLRKLVAGTTPERVARRTEGRLLLVKQRRGALHSGLLDTIEFFRRTEPAS